MVLVALQPAACSAGALRFSGDAALRPEGKDYEMQDGDVVEFMFNK